MDFLLYSKIILGQTDAKGLSQFFYDSWNDTPDRIYKYRVYITRRAFNLNELFFRSEQAKLTPGSNALKSLGTKKRETFLTQTALWSYADELAEYYIAKGKFPLILIVDELVVNGHEITEIMQTLERLVFRAWEKRNPYATDGERRMINSALLMATDIWVYAQSTEDLLLKNSYRNRLKVSVEFKGSEWKIFVQNLSRLLQIYNANVSYLPVANISSAAHANLSEKTIPCWNGANTWTYRLSKIEIWQKNFETSDEWRHMQFAVRCTLAENQKDYCIVPHVFLGSLTSDAVSRLCSKVQKILLNWFSTHPIEEYGKISSYEESHISRLLNCEYKEMLVVRTQFILYLLSLSALDDFMASAGIQFKLSNEEMEKSAQNFGLIQDVKEILKAISEHVELKSLLKDSLLEIINHVSRLYLKSKSTVQASDPSTCIYDTEAILSSAAAQDDAHIAAIRNANAVYDSQTLFFNVIPFSEYFSDRRWHRESEDQKLSTAILMTYANIVSINPHMSSEGVAVGLKLGELTKMLKVRRMYRFLPALLDLENYCDLYGYSIVKMSSQFGRYLDLDESKECYKAVFSKFISEIYACKKKVRDWYINTLSDLDRPDKDKNIRTVQEWSGKNWTKEKEWEEIKDLSQVRYIQWELKKQAEYRQKLAKFLETKHPRQ